MTDPLAGYRLYDKRQYLDILIERINATGRGSQILLMTMSFDPDETEIMRLWQSLVAAAQRGAHIRVGIDARSFLDNNGRPDPARYRTSKLGPLWFHRRLPARLRPPYQAKLDCINQLRALPNADIFITNPPKHRFSLPIAGRSHIKISLVDDQIFMGGCNLSDMKFVDPMIEWRDDALAANLRETLAHCFSSSSIHRGLQDTDQTIKASLDTTIYIDAGVPGQSVIYDTALQLIDEARDWLLITCQYFPGGLTGKHLKQALNRGVKVQILYSHPSHQGLLGSLIQHISLTLERARLPAALFSHSQPKESPLIHAKIIACDAGVMIGSHNYVNAGVRLGTAEIALLSRDVQLAQEIAVHIKSSAQTRSSS